MTVYYTASKKWLKYPNMVQVHACPIHLYKGNYMISENDTTSLERYIRSCFSYIFNQGSSTPVLKAPREFSDFSTQRKIFNG